MRELVLIALAALLALPWRAAAHESAYRPEPGPAPSNGAAAGRLLEYFDVFTKLQCEQPTALQEETLELCHAMYPSFGRYSGVTPTPPPDTSEERLAELLAECRAHYRLLRQQYGALEVTWSQDGAVLESAKPLALTAGLPRYLLVELHNHEGRDATLSAAFEGVAIPSSAAVNVPPGETRAVVAPVAAAEAGSATLVLMVRAEGGAVHAVEVPISAVEPAVVRGVLIEQATGEAFPGRVYAVGADNLLRFGQKYKDNTTLSTKPVLAWGAPARNYRFPFFYSDGRFEVLMPPGDAKLTLERGFEHPLTTMQVSGLKPGETREVRLGSERFRDMKAEGWVSGDTHIHWAKNWWSEDEAIELLAVVQRAEDLRVANNLTLKQVNPGETFIAPAQFPMGPVPGYCDSAYHIQMAEEYRNDMFYGHVCFLNINELILPISTGQGSGGGPDTPDYPTNRWAIEQCHAQGGISTEAHGLGPFGRSDVPANAVLGLSDAFDQLDPAAYYLFLNAGLRIPLGNGSDHPARIAGCARMYVQVDGPFTYQRWIDGIREARTFTTSGPLLTLTVNGRGIGSVLKAGQGETLTARVRAQSRFPLGNVELVRNGAVVESRQTERRELAFEVALAADEPLWLAARCSTSDIYNALVHEGIAHTSAVFVDVDGQRIREPGALRHWIAVLEAHRENVRKNAVFENDAQRREAIAHIEEGIAAYRALLPSI